jgi:FixJ family two-component response regulator
MDEAETFLETVVVIDDDRGVRESLDAMLRSVGMNVACFASTQEFLAYDFSDAPACIVLDIRLPGRNGLDFQDDLAAAQITTPVIIISGYADIPMSVRAMKAGAVEFLTKPVRAQDLLDAVRSAIATDTSARMRVKEAATLELAFGELTAREREVFTNVTAGLTNKQVAAAMGLSEATVKLHRASVMRKMHAKSMADLVRMADRLLSANKKGPDVSDNSAGGQMVPNHHAESPKGKCSAPCAPRIACVDDEPAVCEALVAFLKAHRIAADGYLSAEAFLASPNISKTWCLIADVQLSGLSGLQLQAALASKGIHIPTIFVTAFPDESTRRRAMEGGAVCFLSKPVTKEQLLMSIEAARGENQNSSSLAK